MTKRPTMRTPPKTSPEREASVKIDSTDYKEQDQAQIEQDLELAKPPGGMVKDPKALLDALSKASSQGQPSSSYDAIENAMRLHPGLTREEAEEEAEAFGF